MLNINLQKSATFLATEYKINHLFEIYLEANTDYKLNSFYL